MTTLPATSRAVFAADRVEPTADVRAIADHLREFLAAEIASKKIPAFSIALVDGDRIVWAEGFGTAISATGTPATADTVYRVGSISKLLADMAVMQAVERGQLKLDDDIRSVLPDFAPRNSFGAPVTLRGLMSHRAGLVRESPVGNYFDPSDPGLAATIASLNDTSLIYAPGRRTKYSNAGVAVAGQALEKVSGRSFEDQIQAALLKPLGMSSSTFLRSAAPAPKLAEGWMWSHDGQRFVAPTFDLGTLPAGNLYSSVTDLSRFLVAVFADGVADGKQVIGRELLASMLQSQGTPGQPDYGIGFHISDLDGSRAFGHGGAVYGFSTQIKGLPEEKLGVVAVASLDGANGFVSRVVDQALRMLRAQKRGEPLPKLEITTDVPRERAKSLAGAYRRDDEVIELQAREGRLYLRESTKLSEVRVRGNSLIVDDVFSFGPELGTKTDGEVTLRDATYRRISEPLPDSPPERWRGLIGEYGWDHNTLYIFEDRGRLWTLIEWFYYYPLTEISENEFAFPDYGLYHGEHLRFERDDTGRATQVVAAEVPFERRHLIGVGEVFRVAPRQFLEDLRAAAQKDTPPEERGEFRKSELTEIVTLDAGIRLDIRYATTNNFLGSTFYKQARAFLQRPAAEALVRVQRRAAEQGLGLLIHDGYRPWFVTKMFWEATPSDLRRFVADPSRGSRHNRGCAVDLTLCDLATGEPVEMVANYDEFSTRSYPNYPGGTSRQRWYRALLRSLMEQEGFSVYEFEWWHFDFGDWREYPILNQSFEELSAE